MKIIDLNVLEPVAKELPSEIIKAVLELSPQKPMSLDEMRRRIHMMDALEKSKSSNNLFKIEDADHALLSEAMRTYPWSRAMPSLLAVIDAVINAPAPKDEPEVHDRTPARAGKSG